MDNFLWLLWLPFRRSQHIVMERGLKRPEPIYFIGVLICKVIRHLASRSEKSISRLRGITCINKWYKWCWFAVGTAPKSSAAESKTRPGSRRWERRSTPILCQTHSSDRGTRTLQKHPFAGYSPAGLLILTIKYTSELLFCCEKPKYASLPPKIVRHDRTMEQIVFPVPNICEYLTEESKVRVFTSTERDDQGSKVNHFFQQFDDLYNEMWWQKKMRSTPAFFSNETRTSSHHRHHPNSDDLSCPVDSVFVDNVALFWVAKHISLWGSISFNLAVLVNIAVALFYPFGDDEDEGTCSCLNSQVFCMCPMFSLLWLFLCFVGVLPPFLSVLLWVAVVISTSVLFILPRRGGILAFLITVILRSIYTIGLGPTLLLLGATNVRLESFRLAAERVDAKLASEWTKA